LIISFVTRGDLETHICPYFNLDPGRFAVGYIGSAFRIRADSVTHKQGAENARAGTPWGGEQLSVDYRAQPEWAVRCAIE
jgi:hypothetical protein